MLDGVTTTVTVAHMRLCHSRLPFVRAEKGQIENQVGLARERFFTPRLRFKTYDDMNAWLLDKTVTYA